MKYTFKYEESTVSILRLLFVTKTQTTDQDNQNRQERFTSHALVEVRRFKSLPFGIQSAVLLDISVQGFKLEFTGEFKALVGKTYWLNIPLPPLGIYSPTRLICYTQCRWFDEKRYRIGGVFLELNPTQRMIINQIVETLKEQGAGKG